MKTNNQNTPGNLNLLKASSVAYQKAKIGEVIITSTLLCLAFAYPLCYLYFPVYKVLLFQVSFFLTILIQIISGFLKENTSNGAIFKEQFDVNIFGVPWKSTISKPNQILLVKYAAAYKGKEPLNWYSNKLNNKISTNIFIAVCQRINTGWDIELRKIYRQWLIVFMVCYSISFFLLVEYFKLDGTTIFQICFSILSFYTHFIGLIKGHSAVIEKRSKISAMLDNWIEQKVEITFQQLRDVQDEIYQTRLEPVKVPNFFARWQQKKLNSTFENYVEGVNSKFE
jgi:hypothetical protein